jgi:hypothetical protein
LIVEAMGRKRLRQGPAPALRREVSSFSGFGNGYWDRLRWKPVDVTNENLGDFGDRYNEYVIV